MSIIVLLVAALLFILEIRWPQMSDQAEPRRLVNKVRDASYSIFTIDEKRRMHDLVTTLKARKMISIGVLVWLMDDQLASLAAMQRTFRPRRGRGRHENRPHYQAARPRYQGALLDCKTILRQVC